MSERHREGEPPLSVEYSVPQQLAEKLRLNLADIEAALAQAATELVAAESRLADAQAALAQEQDEKRAETWRQKIADATAEIEDITALLAHGKKLRVERTMKRDRLIDFDEYTTRLAQKLKADKDNPPN